MTSLLVDRVCAFFDAVWSFILTLVRSLLALFTPSSDPSILPSVHHTSRDALTRAHSHLRPILLTPRLIARSSPTQRPYARSAGHASTTAPDPQASELDPNVTEFGLSTTTSIATDNPGPPGTSTSSFRGGTPDTSLLTSLSVLPLTPPDRCYLAPIPSATDCPYAEPWPTNGAPDRSKFRLPGSPLKVTINADSVFAGSIVGPMGSPPPERWSPVHIWTSTPCKNDHPVLPDPALSFSDHHTRSLTDPSPALASISHALISRSRSSIQPYDNASNSSASSDASPSVNYFPVEEVRQQPDATNECHRALKDQPYPQFHFPDAYSCTWRRHGAHVPGKPNRIPHTYAYTRSHSYVGKSVSEWYDANAYVSSPISVLSPPLCESAAKDEDEDELPLGRLRERLARRNANVGANVGLSVPLNTDIGIREAATASPKTRSRTMSEGCLLAFSETTPTRVGVGARADRHVLSLALDGNGYGPKDWLDALSLHTSSKQKDTLASDPHPCVSLPAVNAVAGTNRYLGS